LALAPQFATLPPLSLYVHLPWCVRKCPYCDFNSHEPRAGIPEREYLAAVLTDLESDLPKVWGRTVQTIFIGGGTPSLFSAEAIAELLSGLRARLRLAADAEITLEANPGTVEAERFAGYREAGVNRLSLGIQSFADDKLQALGRIHTAAEARRAIEIAQRHFPRLNLDLMYGLPQQTLAEALADVDAALAFAPAHLSCYQLTLEPNTVFAKYPPPLPDHDTQAAMQEAIEARLAEAGYRHYEVSAFAQPGQVCRHNLNYWQFGDYLGIGAGAHSKLTLLDPPRIERSERIKQPREYLERIAATGQARQQIRLIERRDIGFEFMMNALRLVDGFPVALLQERTGWPISLIEAPLRQIEAEGLIERDHRWIRPTERGQRFLNRALQAFL
jgi:coproporphyrinogen III oxidase, anaerobic (EC 1.3.99.22)